MRIMRTSFSRKTQRSLCGTSLAALSDSFVLPASCGKTHNLASHLPVHQGGRKLASHQPSLGDFSDELRLASQLRSLISRRATAGKPASLADLATSYGCALFLE